MTAPGVEPVQMCNSPSWEIQKLIGVKWNFCWRWHFQFMQPHPLEDSWNKSHLEAFMPYFLPIHTRVESLPILIWWVFSGVCILSCCCSVTKLCQTLWGPMDCSMPGFPVLHYLPEFVQIHVHWVSETIQLSHPLSPSSPALDLSQHQDLFLWVGCSPHMAKIYWSFSSSLPKNIELISFRIDGFDLHAVQGLSRVFSSITTQKHQFFSTQNLWLNSHIYTWLLGKPKLWLYRSLSAKWCPCFLRGCLSL